MKNKFIYLSIFVGDMYYRNDKRNKLHVYLYENENKKTINTRLENSLKIMYDKIRNN